MAVTDTGHQTPPSQVSIDVLAFSRTQFAGLATMIESRHPQSAHPRKSGPT